MDTKEAEQLAQEQLDELKQALKKTTHQVEHFGNPTGISTGPLYDSHGTIAGYDYSGGASVSQASQGYNPYSQNLTSQTSYTLTGAGTTGNWTNQGTGLTFSNPTANTTISASPWWGGNTATNVSGKLVLNGENADIEINGISLLSMLEERLNVLVPNPALEREWDQLKELGEQYRALERDLKEKAEIWNKLKST